MAKEKSGEKGHEINSKSRIQEVNKENYSSIEGGIWVIPYEQIRE